MTTSPVSSARESKRKAARKAMCEYSAAMRSDPQSASMMRPLGVYDIESPNMAFSSQVRSSERSMETPASSMTRRPSWTGLDQPGMGLKNAWSPACTPGFVGGGSEVARGRRQADASERAVSTRCRRRGCAAARTAARRCEAARQQRATGGRGLLGFASAWRWPNRGGAHLRVEGGRLLRERGLAGEAEHPCGGEEDVRPRLDDRRVQRQLGVEVHVPRELQKQA